MTSEETPAPSSEPVPPTTPASAESKSEPPSQPAGDSPTAGQPGKPQFRVKIGSLGDPSIKRTVSPQPQPLYTPRTLKPADAGSAGDPPVSAAAATDATVPAKPSETDGPPSSAAEAAVPAKSDKGPRGNKPSRKGEPPAVPPAQRVDIRSVRDVDAELDALMGDASMGALLENQALPAAEGELEPESERQGRIARIHRDNVFIDLGAGAQGVVLLQQFKTEPTVGAEIKVVVGRFNAAEGLYEVTVFGSAASVADWSDLHEGMVVQTTITGHNKGGLECTVRSIRGFIPASQIDVVRVEDLAPYVGQSLPAVVTEANPDRRNLVLSRRAMIERDRAEAKAKLVETLAVGQVHEGIVRGMKDFGAFVDLGGVDGLIHISKLSWDRIAHPSEILKVGQKVNVRIEKYDADTGKISLEYLEKAANPWATATERYHVGAKVKGVVSRLMDFGAFVKLEPGIEGLVHVSEISYKRIWKPAEVLKQGQTIEALVQAVDPEAQRMSLSIKALEAKPEAPAATPEPEVEEPPPPPRKQFKGTLKGGIGRASGGEQFGLKF